MITVDEKKHLIVVVGMHRSGTSAIACLLQLFGVNLGTKLMEAVPGVNEKGFFEDLDITNFNDLLLTALGENWHSLSPRLTTRQCADAVIMQPLREQAIALLERKIANYDWFGIKDPRISRLLPFWKEVFAALEIDVRYLLAIRNPLSVAASLKRRDGFRAEKSYYLWLQHVIPAVLETMGSQRAVLDFHRLMASPEAEVRRLAAELGLADRLDEAALDDYCRRFLDPRFCHTAFDLRDLEQELAVPRLAAEAFATLSRVGAGHVAIDSPEVTSRFCEFSYALESLRPALHLMAELDRQNVEQTRQIAERDQALAERDQALAERDQTLAERDQALAERDQALAGRDQMLAERDSQIDILKRERDALLNSTSWRVTKPIRRAITVLRGRQHTNLTLLLLGLTWV